MLDRAWGESFRWIRVGRPQETRRSARAGQRPVVETLEGRQMLAASIAAISPVSVFSSLGTQVPLNGSGSNATNQTFTVTSSNPDVKASVAVGQFMTINVTHTAANSSDVNVNGSITYQLFNDLTPTTATLFEQFVNSGYYTNKTIHRIVSGFSGVGGPTDYVLQGGSPNGSGGGNSGQPGTPFGLELNQALPIAESGALAVANTGQPNSNDTQFFWTTGPQNELNFKYTMFGQEVSGFNVTQQLTQVATQTNGSGEKSSPINPVTITSASLSTTNPNGVIHIDATAANAGETSTITVTATDPATHTTATQSFVVTVVPDTTNSTAANNGHPASFTFMPLTAPVTAASAGDQPITVTLSSINGNPNNTAVKTQYALVGQPSHGTITNFNAAAGTLTYTPTAGFTGTDTFTYTASNVGGSPSPLAGNTSTVTITDTAVPVGPSNPPVSTAVTANAFGGQPKTVTLTATNNNPNNPAVTTRFALTSQPQHGTVTNFNATTGTFTYTPTPGYSGNDVFSFQPTNVGGTPSSIPGNISPITISDLPSVPGNTGSVRIIAGVLVVTPPPTSLKATNTIIVSEFTSATAPTDPRILVTVNGVIDSQQPETSKIARVVVFGTKSNDNIGVDKSLDASIPVALDGGTGGKNTIQGGAGDTLEHGWFGKNTLIGGTGTNQLVGRKGHVRFKPTTTTSEIFAGIPRPGYTNFHEYNGKTTVKLNPPGGTFYRYVKGKLVPIATK